MKKERNDLKAGLFIVVSLVLIVAVIVGIKGIGRLIEPSQTATVTFKLSDDLGGLREGDDVRIGGFKVGVVRDIALVDQPAGTKPYIVVHCSIPLKFQIKKDARVTVQSTLTGSSWLNFDDLGSPDAPLLAASDTVTGRPSMFSTIMASASDLGPELRETVRDVRTQTIPKVNETIDTYKTTGAHATALVKYIRSQIPDPIIARYVAVADRAKGMLGHLEEVFGETKGDLKSSIRNVNVATTSVKDKLPGILDKVDASLVKVQTSLDSTNVALEDIKKIASNTRDATGSARSILTSNRSKIDDMIDSLKTTGDNLKFASAEIRRSPWRLLYKPGPGEVANLNLYDSARQFAEGANDLSDAASALRDALNDPDVTQDRVQNLVDRLDKSFANFGAIEQELWKQVR
jgi:phospholipid/cholesterol/gamma-HCH transport system substrate-binding protein